MPKPHPYLGQSQHSANQDQNQYSDNEARALQAAYSTMPEASTTPVNDPLAGMFADIASQSGAMQFGTEHEPKYVAAIAASMVTVSLSEKVPVPVLNNSVIANLLFNNEMLRAEIYKASAYLRAGVQLSIIKDPNADTNREIIFAQNNFLTSEPLTFETLSDGAEVTAQTNPIQKHGFKIAEHASLGASFVLSRRMQKDVPQHALHGLIYASIAQGVAKAIDIAISNHLGNLTLAPFTLAAAAARGLSIGDLKGITSGTSENAVLDRGDLFLKGIRAELCSGVGSFVLCPSKFAVAMPESITIASKRLNNGGLEVTIFTNAEILSTVHSTTAVWSA